MKLKRRLIMIVAALTFSLLGNLFIVPTALAQPDPDFALKNQPEYWEAQGYGECVKYDGVNAQTFTVPAPPAGKEYTLAVVKAGSGQSTEEPHETHEDVEEGDVLRHSSGKDISFVILCFDDDEEEENGNGNGNGGRGGGESLGTTTTVGPSVAVLPDTGVRPDFQTWTAVVASLATITTAAWFSRRRLYPQVLQSRSSWRNNLNLRAGVARTRQIATTSAVTLSLLVMPLGYNPIVRQVHAEPTEAVAAPEPTPIIPVAPTHGNPVRITVPALGIDLPVAEGTYNAAAETWSVSTKQANYATNTAPANNVAGDTLIYAHNTKDVFGSLKNLGATDSVFVYTDNGQIFEYSFAEHAVVAPTDTVAISDTDGNADLKLMTCDGTWAQNRRVVSLTLVNIN